MTHLSFFVLRQKTRAKFFSHVNGSVATPRTPESDGKIDSTYFFEDSKPLGQKLIYIFYHLYNQLLLIQEINDLRIAPIFIS